MRIGEAIIQNRNIDINTKNEFYATYKGKKIHVSASHGFGEAKEYWLTRFNIDVIDIKSGMKDVETYEDCHDIREAIRCALKGACLITE